MILQLISFSSCFVSLSLLSFSPCSVQFCFVVFALFCSVPTPVHFLLIFHYLYTFVVKHFGYEHLSIHIIQPQTLYILGSMVAIDSPHRHQNLCSKAKHSNLL